MGVIWLQFCGCSKYTHAVGLIPHRMLRFTEFLYPFYEVFSASFDYPILNVVPSHRWRFPKMDTPQIIHFKLPFHGIFPFNIPYKPSSELLGHPPDDAGKFGSSTAKAQDRGLICWPSCRWNRSTSQPPRTAGSPTGQSDWNPGTVDAGKKDKTCPAIHLIHLEFPWFKEDLTWPKYSFSFCYFTGLQISIHHRLFTKTNWFVDHRTS